MVVVALTTLALWPIEAFAQDEGPSSQSRPAEEKKPESQPFVDRDGDGIQDGQERRFRRQKRGKNRRQDESRRRRQRQRSADPDRAQPAPHGP
ncbi:MAG: hypothetical protein JXR83_23565 [Deltaproteobacteria bacterium]|nr:hypothetical protein [Deltaproteobacteria bacterium]